jgi:hypothetical protein
MNKEEKAEYDRRYRAEHRDKILEQKRQYYVEHRESELERQRRYHAEHREAANERFRQARYNKGGQSMSENRSCSSFLGIYVAEQLLSHLFKNVTRMPNNNPGFDFICGQGYMVDTKSCCNKTSPYGKIFWTFTIKHNPVADYFLCIAFDNRIDLNPLHYWLIPGGVLSHLVKATISESTLMKWAEYEKPIDEAICCCNTMKEGI